LTYTPAELNCLSIHPQALREIQASPHAKRVFEQIKAQEATKQAELKTKEAEFKAAAEKAAIVSITSHLSRFAVQNKDPK